jgi:phosphopantetheinyl transferase
LDNLANQAIIYLLNIQNEYCRYLNEVYPLSKSSLARLNNKKTDLARRQFLASRSLIQHAISENPCLKGWSIDSAEIEEGEKPSIIGNDNCYLSLSHSGNFVVVMISTTSGAVDIEVLGKRRNISGIVSYAFHELEGLYINMPNNPIQKEKNFYEIWTLRECYLKLGIMKSLLDSSFNSIEVGKLGDKKSHTFFKGQYIFSYIVDTDTNVKFVELNK